VFPTTATCPPVHHHERQHKEGPRPVANGQPSRNHLEERCQGGLEAIRPGGRKKPWHSALWRWSTGRRVPLRFRAAVWAQARWDGPFLYEWRSARRVLEPLQKNDVRGSFIGRARGFEANRVHDADNCLVICSGCGARSGFWPKSPDGPQQSHGGPSRDVRARSAAEVRFAFLGVTPSVVPARGTKTLGPMMTAARGLTIARRRPVRLDCGRGVWPPFLPRVPAFSSSLGRCVVVVRGSTDSHREFLG